MGLIVGKIPEDTKVIDKDAALNPGDIVELYFDVIGGLKTSWLRAVQWQWIENRLEQPYNGWEVISYRNTETQLIVECEVTEQTTRDESYALTANLGAVGAIVITAVVIAIAIFGKSVFDFLSLIEVRKREAKQMESLPGQAAMVLQKAGIGTIGIGLIALAAVFFLSKK